jgi:hypothetical protein
MEELSTPVKIGIIRGQTNYTETDCVRLLEEHNGDYICVIKQYMGISTTKKEPQIKSLNQEIYKQFRRKLDIQEFNDKQASALSVSEATP